MSSLFILVATLYIICTYVRIIYKTIFKGNIYNDCKITAAALYIILMYIHKSQ